MVLVLRVAQFKKQNKKNGYTHNLKELNPQDIGNR